MQAVENEVATQAHQPVEVRPSTRKTRQAEQLAEKLKFLSFRGALRAEESLFSCV
jgi:hypothetical protein